MMGKYERKFREVESKLRPRSKWTHGEAVAFLAAVVEEADNEIKNLRSANYLFGILIVAAPIIVGVLCAIF